MGRKPHTLLGLTAVQWATALGDTSRAGLHRARQSLAGRRPVPAEEAVQVADFTGADLGELARALAALRGYLPLEGGDPLQRPGERVLRAIYTWCAMAAACCGVYADDGEQGVPQRQPQWGPNLGNHDPDWWKPRS